LLKLTYLIIYWNLLAGVDEQSISSELLDAFDTLLSALAVHSQAGMEQAGAIALTRLYYTVTCRSDI